MFQRSIYVAVCLSCVFWISGCKTKLAYNPNEVQETFQVQTAPSIPLRVAIVDTDKKPEPYRERQTKEETMVIDIYPASLNIYADALREVFSEVAVISEHETLRLKEYDFVAYVATEFQYAKKGKGRSQFTSKVVYIDTRADKVVHGSQCTDAIETFGNSSVEAFQGLAMALLGPIGMQAETEQRSKDILELLRKNAAKQATAAENGEKLIAYAGKRGKVLAKASKEIKATASATKSSSRVKADPSLTRAVADMRRGREDSRAYLFAVGIEDYKAAPSVPYAGNSLKIMAALLAKKYGVPMANQVILMGDSATGQAIQGNMRNLAARMTENDVLFFYYAGHGLAGKNGREVFMLPSDVVRGAYEDDDFALNKIITDHFADKARVYAFLDTCFSGRADNNSMLTKGVAPVYKTTPHKLPDNVTVFFAGKGDQFANYYPEKGHRLFSYYVARSILDGKTDVKEMELYVKDKVRDTSTRMGADHVQEPFVGGETRCQLGE